MDDVKIVALFFARDEAAIQHTADVYGARLRAISQNIVRDMPTAEECENDTYLQAWHSIPPHAPQTYLFAFLARIIRHVSLNRCRDRQRLKRWAYLCELSAEMEQCIPSPDDCECRMDEQLFADIINRFLSSLSQPKRVVFLRRYWYLDSITDIAARYGYSESRVKTMLFRTRNELRHYLEREGYAV